MATTKKSTKKAPAKKQAVKHAPAKATATKVTHSTHSAKGSKATVSKKDEFMTFRLTRETLYWIIFGATAVALALWVLTINVKVNRIYDQIDQTNRETSNLMIPQKHVKKN